MTHDWLLVETLGNEPVVVAQGDRTQNLVPIGAFLRRNPHLMAIQSAIGETVRGGQPLSSITPKHDRVIRTEIVQMTDGLIHGVHVWAGPPDVDPPERGIPGPLKWDLTNKIATDTTESLSNGGLDPSVETTHGRAFAEDLPTRDFSAAERQVLELAIKPEPGRTFCTTWNLTDFTGAPITVGFVGRIILDDDSNALVCRAMNWRSAPDENTVSPRDLGRRVFDGGPRPGVHRALVDLQSWALLKWLDEPCPFYDWRLRGDGEPMSHPDDDGEIAGMTRDFTAHSASRVLRLRAVDGGWTPIHVTLNRVELRDGVSAGLLSLREPTADELSTARQRRRTLRRG